MRRYLPPTEGGAMAIDESRVGVVAASLMEEISHDHERHTNPRIRTVGLLVAVEYEDPDADEGRTKIHSRFHDGPEFKDCPTYVALGLIYQIAKHIG
jgi:hypothetical protein